jgi:hypothetical protein
MSTRNFFNKLSAEFCVQTFLSDERKSRPCEDAHAHRTLSESIDGVLHRLLTLRPKNTETVNQMWDENMAISMGNGMSKIIKEGAPEGRMARNLAVLDHAIVRSQAVNMQKTHGVLSAMAGMVMPVVLHPDIQAVNPGADMHYMMMLQRTAAMNEHMPLPVASRTALRDQLETSAQYCEDKGIWPNNRFKDDVSEVIDSLSRSPILAPSA